MISPVAANPQTQAEYSVYVYLHPDDVEENHTDWEMKRVTHNRLRALKLAQKLFESQNYARVEIKKKSFDEKYGCMLDKTLKIFEPEKTGFWGFLKRS